MTAKPINDLSFRVLTLGCAKNEVETEFIEGSLKSEGLRIADLEDAQIIIVNTCGFIEAAKEESIEAIFEAAKNKKEGSCNALIVTGCLAQRYPEALFEEIPEVDGIIGLSHVENLSSYIKEILNGKRICKAGSLSSHYKENRVRNVTEKPYAYLQIADGCDNSCTYCAIPMIRGRYRSRSLDSLLAEAGTLLAEGVKEIVLIGQDTACYGIDLYGERKLSSLICELGKLDELRWIRLLYCQPQNFSDRLMGVIADNPKVCHYVDIPLQHASKKILGKMGRKGDRTEYLKLIGRIRKKIPDVAIRTSLILGFPGESDEDFEELMLFVEEAGFDYIGLFEYSAEENTVACNLPNHVPKEVVRERFAAMSDLRDAAAQQKRQSYLGRKSKMLVESISRQKSDSKVTDCRGRTPFQAPEIDGEIRAKTVGTKLSVGDIVDVELKTIDDYDFEGELEC